MEKIFEETYKIRQFHVDAFGRLNPSALLGLVQDVATSHYDLVNPDLIWVVSRHHVEITRLPQAEETVRMETWALPPTRAAFPRATVAYGGDGGELFRSISLWVLIRRDSRALVLPGKVDLPMVTTIRGLELPNPTSLAPRQFDRHTSRRIRYSLLDVNGHMNNARYLDWVEDLLPLDFHREKTLREFTVCYLSEGRPEEEVDIGYSVENGTVRVDGRCGQERVFSAQAIYE